MHPMTCGTCGDPTNMTACAGCARRDLEGMRSFQVKFMKADHEKRELELQKRDLSDALWTAYAELRRFRPEVNGAVFDEVCIALKRSGFPEKRQPEKRKCDSSTGADGCVSCVKETGHEMPHSDGNLISWRP